MAKKKLPIEPDIRDIELDPNPPPVEKIASEKHEGKGEKRLFQVGKTEKAWLTKAEAVKAGKFWAD